MYQLFWSFDNHDLFQGDIRQLIWAQSQTPWWKKSRKSSWCVPIKGKHWSATTLRNNPWVESAPLRLLPKTQSLAFESCWLTGFNHLFIFLCHPFTVPPLRSLCSYLHTAQTYCSCAANQINFDTPTGFLKAYWMPSNNTSVKNTVMLLKYIYLCLQYSMCFFSLFARYASGLLGL